MSFRQSGTLKVGSTITVSDGEETVVLTIKSAEGVNNSGLPTLHIYKVSVDTGSEVYEDKIHLDPDIIRGRGYF